MYIFLELAPALMILPVLWLVYRPPLRLWAVAAALGITLVLWSPYLAFEVRRGFVDLYSQLLQQDILPAYYAQSWCDPSLALRAGEGAAPHPDSVQGPSQTLGTQLRARGTAVIYGLSYNFERVARLRDAILGSPVKTVLLMFAVSSLAILGFSASSRALLRRWWRPGSCS